MFALGVFVSLFVPLTGTDPDLRVTGSEDGEINIAGIGNIVALVKKQNELE